MLSLSEYKELNKEDRQAELDRLEQLIKYTERSTQENDVLNEQLEKLYHFYNLGHAYLDV